MWGAHNPKHPGAKKSLEGIQPILKNIPKAALEQCQAGKNRKWHDSDQERGSKYFVEHKRLQV